VTARHVWSVEQVADAVGPAANVRNYLEQRDLRRCLAKAATLAPIRRAADVGCGYGRLTMVLTELAEEVVGFEREAAFVEQAARLLPSVRFVRVESLGSLPRETGSVDFAMTFTVLQHLRDAEAREMVAEVKRIAEGGVVLLTEETDPALADGGGPGGSPSTGRTTGRPEAVYAEWMRPFERVLSFPREIEPGYPRRDVGTYMLFAAPARAR
jgi:SAM-dependent methyltransferase